MRKKTLATRYIFILQTFLACVVFSCKSNDGTRVPAHLLDQYTMAHYLADAFLLENHVAQARAHPDSIRHTLLQEQIYPLLDKKYHLLDSQAYLSYQYYLTQPEILNQILGIAIDSLTQLSHESSFQSDKN